MHLYSKRLSSLSKEAVLLIHSQWISKACLMWLNTHPMGDRHTDFVWLKLVGLLSKYVVEHKDHIKSNTCDVRPIGSDQYSRYLIILTLVKNYVEDLIQLTDSPIIKDKCYLQWANCMYAIAYLKSISL